jgi:hypothetical protein
MSELLKSIRGADAAVNAEIARQMMNTAVSNIETLPDFTKLLPGKWLVGEVISCSSEDHEEHGVKISLQCTIDACIELAQYPNVPVADLPQELLPAPGSLVSFSWTGALGVQQFIKVCGELIAQIGEAVSVPEVIERLSYNQFAGMALVTGQRKDKEKTELDLATGKEVPVLYTTLQKIFVV